MKASEILFELDHTSNYLLLLLYKARNQGSWDEQDVSILTKKADDLREEIAKFFELGEYRGPTE